MFSNLFVKSETLDKRLSFLFYCLIFSVIMLIGNGDFFTIFIKRKEKNDRLESTICNSRIETFLLGKLAEIFCKSTKYNILHTSSYHEIIGNKRSNFIADKINLKMGFLRVSRIWNLKKICRIFSKIGPSCKSWIKKSK